MIYLYHMDADYNVVTIEKVTAPGFNPQLGAAFAIEASTMAVGAPGADSGAGVTLIMENRYGNWSAERFISDYKGLDPITGGAIECGGGVAGRFACDQVDLLSFLPLSALGGGRGTMANDVWGWTDPETGHEYALVGLSDATAFVDVTDPINPVYVGRLPKTETAPAAAWRDIKIDENHAYIVADAAPTHGVQVFDLERLREYAGEPIVFDVDAHYDRISAAHNIVINEDSAFAYVVGANSGGETCGGGLHMINIEDPNNPSFAGCFADVSTGIQGTGYSHDAQCVIYHGPDEQYRGHEICIGSNETALSVADVTDKRNPVALGAATYPKVAYSHQGWFDDEHEYFYMNDEGDEVSGLVEGTRTLIWDLRELEDPILVGEYISENPAVDHNLYIKGDRMFQSNYDSGLRIFDISDRENIRPIAYFDTVPWGPDGGGMTGSWSNFPYFESGIVVVTSMNEGVFIVRPREGIGS
jgi:choice-of-anchor B domain-containing protein